MRQVTGRDRCEIGLGLSVGERSPTFHRAGREEEQKEGGKEERGQGPAGRGSDIRNGTSSLIP